MKNFYQIPVFLFLFLFLFCETPFCNAEANAKVGFAGFVITKFEPVKTPKGYASIDLPNPRDAELIKTVFGKICNDRNYDIYTTNGDSFSSGMPTYERVKKVLKKMAKSGVKEVSENEVEYDIKTKVVLLNTHGFVNTVTNELNFLFSDSRITIDADGNVHAVNTMSVSELAEIILQFQCEQIVLILDCCYAGNTRPLSDLLEEKIKNGGKEMSVTILCSAGGDQTSQVFIKREMSLYTGYILAALSGLGDKNKDGKVSVEEMHDYSYSLVGMVSQVQEREYNDDNVMNKNTGSNDSSKKEVPIQKPQIRKIVSNGHSNVEFAIPSLPYKTTMDFLAQNIKDIIQLHNLDPNEVCVYPFKCANSNERSDLGERIKSTIDAEIHPNVTFKKNVIARPVRQKKYQYAIEGEFSIPMVENPEDIHNIFVKCRIRVIDTRTIMEMYIGFDGKSVKETGTTVSDLDEIEPLVEQGAVDPEYVDVSLARVAPDGKRVPVPKNPNGDGNDYVVRRGDTLVVKVHNKTDKHLGFICLADGLNVVVRENETDAERVCTRADDIEKVRYLIVGPDSTYPVKGWMTIDNKVSPQTNRLNIQYNDFVVQDAPQSLRSRLNVDPNKPEAPLGSIRVLVFETREVPKDPNVRGAADNSDAEMHVTDSNTAAIIKGERHETTGKKSVYKIPSSQAKVLEVVELHYAFEKQNAQ